MTSKYLVTFFITTQILFGFDFGFISKLNKRYKALAYCISLLSTVILLCSSFFTIYLGTNVGYVFTANYIIIVTILKFRGSKHNLTIFFDDLLIIDKRWKTGISHHKFFIIMGLYAITMTLSRWLVTIAYAAIVGSHNVALVLAILLPVLPVVGTDLLPIINGIIYHEIYKRIIILKTGLRHSKYNLETARVYFDDNADCFEKVRAEHDNLVSCENVMSTTGQVVTLTVKLAVASSIPVSGKFFV